MLRNDSEVVSDGVWTRVLVRVLRPSVLLPANSRDFIVLRQLSHVSKLYICKLNGIYSIQKILSLFLHHLP